MSVELRNFTAPQRMERLPMSGYQKYICAVLTTAWFFDSIDLAMLTFLLGSIKTEFALSTVQAGLISSVTFIGMFIGATSSGLLGDKIGRKIVLQWSMVIWGLASAAICFVPDYNTLLILRFVLGLGLGLELPVAQTLLTEILPAAKRGRYLSFLQCGWPIGFCTAGAIALIFMPYVGWRGIFLLEAIPAVFVLFIRRALYESPRWLEHVGRKEESHQILLKIEEKVKKSLGLTVLPDPVADKELAVQHEVKFSFKELWTPEYTKRTIMVWSMWLFILLGYYGLTTWIGALLQAAGYSVQKSVQYTLTMALLGLPGTIIAGALQEKFGRKRVLIFFLMTAAISAYLYGNAWNLATLILFGSMLQYSQFSFMTVVYTWTPELYPTRARSTGCGFASGMGRLGSIVGPYVVGVIIPTFGQSGVFSLGAVAFIIAGFAVGILGVETGKQTLEKVSQ